MFSDYIVYADESGDHGLVNIDPAFPVFALAFCLVKISDYVDDIVPEFQRFKFDVFGHDAIVLHENDIRRSKGPFAILLTDPVFRAGFYERLNRLIIAAPIKIFASVTHKDRLVQRYTRPWSPYEISLYFCMEKLLDKLLNLGQRGKRIHILFESRGPREDAELELEFRRIAANATRWGYRTPDFSQVEFEPKFVSKAANSTGLQLADLTARPLALRCLRPLQENRTFEILRPKLGLLKSFP
ncbi:DUF3800 domain-containing protein [Aureimonas glaciei]|uniref:3-deoxy-D-manno-octulosonic acid transferase n=1 Tax=Aureimonas glaciei TaxID=1776957 RepID=A0A917DCL2_9HYPH|nr:DUF3800 domain-containing protein [Aureimonas glaciei]GGD29019.1 3-deoxy-D-manno-octulosonic acid transferase [Aureimonas glaciei]